VFIAGFGLPLNSHEDDAKRAVETALELQARLAELKIPSSVGVTTGQAFCGDVGTNQRREYVILLIFILINRYAMVGDIVNLSARLMAAAKGGVLTDHDTFEAASSFGTLIFEPQEPIRVKGKANPIVVYVPSKNKQKMDNGKSFANNAMIGREDEMKIMHKSFK
jgi:class 3 adenylate cyclase